MNYFKSILIAICFVIGLQFSDAQVTMQPNNPIPGERIVIEYDPSTTLLEGESTIIATAFLFEGDTPIAVEIDLRQKNEKFVGELITTKNSKAVFLKFADLDGKKIDHNNNDGYYQGMHQSDRSSMTPGASANLATGFNSYARYIGIKSNKDKAKDLFYAEYVDQKSDYDDLEMMQNFGNFCNRNAAEEGKAIVEQWIDAKLKTRTEEDLTAAYRLASTQRKSDQMKTIKEEITQKYPDGKFILTDKINAVYRERDKEKKIAAYNALPELKDLDKPMKSMVGYIYNGLAYNYGKDNDWANYDKFLAKIESPGSRAGSLNSLAWRLSGESLDKEGEHIDKGLAYSKQSLDLIEKQITTPNLKDKPAYMTERDWKKSLKNTYGMYADTYALLASKNGKHQEALEYQSIACKANKFEDAEMNERYCIFTEKVKDGKFSYQEVDRIVKTGHASQATKDQHKRLFMAHMNIESAYSEYIAAVEETAELKMKAHLKETMIDLQAPDFALLNLDGEKVALSELKGKVVVVDFWATWCGPCKASFPGMQKAVDNFKDHDDVEFLFVDTWERSKEKEKGASEFITKNGYTFNVLMDNDNKAVADYGVEGIPSKFIIGKDNRIKFKSVGFSGDNDALAKELELMINMLGGGLDSKTEGTE